MVLASRVVALTVEKITKQIAPSIEPGETVVAACRVMPEGAASEFIFTATRYRQGALGYVVSTRMADRMVGDLPERERGAAEVVGFPLAPELLLVLSDRRFMVFGLTKLTNRPTEVLGAVPLEELAGVERDEGRLVASTVPRLVLRFRGGDALGLLAARPHTALLDGLADAIRSRLAPSA